jgi:aspartyl-tRNA(Asn)/glutamyl-tRNA(Gln) amidotransferase subunit A
VPRPAEVGGAPVDPELDDCYAFVFPANLAGLPAVSVPCGLDEAGLPVGLQFTAGPWRDDDALAAAVAWEALP